MPAINPVIIIWCGITKIFCFADGTRIVVQEDNRIITKNINEIKKDDMVLVYNGKQKRFAKVLKNIKIEGKHEFYNIKMKSIKNNVNTKEIKVTGEHVMITFDKNKEINDNKYNLVVNGGVVYANGILVSTVCSKEEAKIIKPTMEEWKKFQENKIPLTLL